jgi:hypothetical protein
MSLISKATKTFTPGGTHESSAEHTLRELLEHGQQKEFASTEKIQETADKARSL